MRFVYLSRPSNRSGFFVLKHLLEETRHAPACVFLPASGRPLNPIGNPHPVQAFNHHRFTGSIAELAETHGIPVARVNNLNSGRGLATFLSHKPELVVLGGGWPQLLKTSVISHPPLGVINTHPSLLPEFRGTDVHRWQVLEGTPSSGATIHYVDDTFDTGSVLAQASFETSMEDTPQRLAERSALLSGPMMAEVLERIEASAPAVLPGTPQGAPAGTPYFGRWPWSDLDFLRIDWSLPARQIARLVLASTQESYCYNGPYFYMSGKRFLVRQARAEAAEGLGAKTPGRIAALDEPGPLVECGQGAIRLLEIQPASDQFWPEGFHSTPAVSGSEFALSIRNSGSGMLA